MALTKNSVGQPWFSCMAQLDLSLLLGMCHLIVFFELVNDTSQAREEEDKRDSINE